MCSVKYIYTSTNRLFVYIAENKICWQWGVFSMPSISSL